MENRSSPVLNVSLKRSWLFRRAVATSLIVIALLAGAHGGPRLTQVKIVVTQTPTSWPIYIAKEGGYYEKQGLDVKLLFAVHPAPIAMLVSGEAQMANYTLDQAMQASSIDGSFVSIGSLSKKSLFALMAEKTIRNVRDLSGKRVGVSQIGDGPYNYTLKILAQFGLTPRDVQWVPLGNNRESALISGRIDATLLNAPAYFRLEEAGFRSLANIADYDDIYAATVHLYTKQTLTENGQLPELLVRSHAEAIKRFYEDKAFAVKAYLEHDTQNIKDVNRVYDYYVKAEVFQRIPYVQKAAVTYIRDNQYDPRIAERMHSFDFRLVIDNSLVDRLVRQGVFETLYGRGIKSEQERQALGAFH